MAANVLVAYFCWLFGGWFGLHHFYLGRDRQTVVWACTASGFFGLGWLADLFNIPDYVRAANQESSYVATLARRMAHAERPPFSTARFFGELCFGWLLGFLVSVAIPEEILKALPCLAFMSPAAVAVGVHTVANIGHVKCPLYVALGGAYLALPWYFVSSDTDISAYLNYSAIFSSIAVHWKGVQWRRAPRRPRNCCVRLACVTSCCLLVAGLWTSALYHNLSFTTQYGEKIRLKDALHNLLTSPAYAETRETLHRLWQHLLIHGLGGLMDEVTVAFDPDGETNSYRVLNISKTASQDEVNQQYRQMVKQHHPDRVTVETEEERRVVEQRFIEIQKAYETVSTIKQKRQRKNEL